MKIIFNLVLLLTLFKQIESKPVTPVQSTPTQGVLIFVAFPSEYLENAAREITNNNLRLLLKSLIASNVSVSIVTPQLSYVEVFAKHGLLVKKVVRDVIMLEECRPTVTDEIEMVMNNVRTFDRTIRQNREGVSKFVTEYQRLEAMRCSPYDLTVYFDANVLVCNPDVTPLFKEVELITDMAFVASTKRTLGEFLFEEEVDKNVIVYTNRIVMRSFFTEVEREYISLMEVTSDSAVAIYETLQNSDHGRIIHTYMDSVWNCKKLADENKWEHCDATPCNILGQ